MTIAALGAAIGATGNAQGRNNALSFTYQGVLQHDGQPLNGAVDLRFSLFDAPTGGIQFGTSVDVPGIVAQDGQITAIVEFDFPSFSEASVELGQWLEIAVRTAGSGDDFTTLSPRQPVTSVPFAQATRGINVAANGSVIVGSVFSTPLDVPVQVFADEGSSGVLYLEHPGDQALESMLTLRVPEDVDHFFKYIDCRAGTNSFSPTRFEVRGSGAMLVEAEENGVLRLRRSTDDFSGAPAQIHLTAASGVSSIIESRPFAGGMRIDPANGRLGIGINPQHTVDIRHPIVADFTSWGIRISNIAQDVFQAGLRVTNDGFFEVTNKVTGPANPARLSTTGVWEAVSDARRKTDIADLGPVLNRVMKLRPVSYRYKDDRGIGYGPVRQGFLAQDVRTLFPSLVSEGDGLLTLDYATMSTLAIAALQEQQRELQHVQDRLDRAVAHNAELQQRLDAIEARLADLDGAR